jgi:hypothetical protein
MPHPGDMDPEAFRREAHRVADRIATTSRLQIVSVSSTVLSSEFAALPDQRWILRSGERAHELRDR